MFFFNYKFNYTFESLKFVESQFSWILICPVSTNFNIPLNESLVVFIQKTY